jgi:hypothetical protein
MTLQDQSCLEKKLELFLLEIDVEMLLVGGEDIAGGVALGSTKWTDSCNRSESLEFAAGSGLVKADAAGGDVGLEVVFAFDGRAGETAEHGELADVIEGVGDGALEETFRWAVERFGRGEEIVKLFYRPKKALDFAAPWQRCGSVPGLLALRDRKSPVEQVAHVREDLRGRARLVSDVEARKMVRSAAQGFAAAVGDGGEGVAEKLAVGIG